MGKYNNVTENDYSHGVKLNFVDQKGEDKCRDLSFTIIVSENRGHDAGSCSERVSRI